MFRRSPRRIGSVVATAVAVLVGLGSGVTAAAAPTIEPVAAPETPPKMAIDTEPDCDRVGYTPAGAVAPMSGELCVPVGHHGDVVILIHGGGGYEGDPADVAVWRDAHLAARRATFVIDYTLLDTGSDAAAYPRPEQNVMAAVQYIRILGSEGMLEVDDVILHGFSAGARLAAVVATAADDPAYAGAELHQGVSTRVDGAILFYGYYDGSQFHGEQYYGAADVPVAASTIAMASADDAPVLIVHGTDDVMTDPAGAAALADALESEGVDVELLLLEGENHVFDGYGTDSLTAAGAALVPVIDSYVGSVAERRSWIRPFSGRSGT
ncbi:MAG: prolyl oligopeptidase family serine peptidase [Acidimicrobiales bacterium]